MHTILLPLQFGNSCIQAHLFFPPSCIIFFILCEEVSLTEKKVILAKRMWVIACGANGKRHVRVINEYLVNN